MADGPRINIKQVMIAIQEYHFNIYFETRPAGCQSSWSAQRNALRLHSTPLPLCVGAGQGPGLQRVQGSSPAETHSAHVQARVYKQKGFADISFLSCPVFPKPERPVWCRAFRGCPARGSRGSCRLHPAIPTKAGLAREHGKRCGCFMPHETPSSPERNGSHSDWRSQTSSCRRSPL